MQIAKKTFYSFIKVDASNCLKSSNVLISAAFLSFRQRKIRGKRKAKPALCRLLSAIPSNAISKTNSGLTVLTGPNFSIAFLVTNEFTSLISYSFSILSILFS